VDHHGVAVDIRQLPYGIGVVVLHGAFVDAVAQRPATHAEAVDEHVPGLGGYGVSEPFRQPSRYAKSTNMLERLNEEIRRREVDPVCETAGAAC
jgi:hypothetical protein